MTGSELLALGLTLPPTLLWLAVLAAVGRTIRSLPPLAERDPREGEPWPPVTVIVPARDEEESLGPALDAHLAQDYPALQIVVVDDRSRDRTPAIVAARAARDPRLRGVRIEALPEGWLGKLHAMAEGVRRAEGEWLLFTDADVRFGPATLRRAIGYALEHRLDFLSLMPQVESAGFLGDVVFNAFGPLMALSLRLHRVKEEGAAAAGSGAFLLVRRAAYDAGPGLAWMPLEVADDQAMCLLVKAHGGRCELVHGVGEVRLRWYRSFAEMRRRTQKNFFALVGRFSVGRSLLAALLLAWLALFPLAGLLGEAAWSWWAPGVGLAALLGAALWSARWSARPWAPSLAAPLGLLLVAYLVIRAALIGWRIGGIEWRDRRYPTALLRNRQRFRL